MSTPCTCRDEAYDMFAPMCQATYHHWQAMLELGASGAPITWNEDYVSREDDVCHCKACRP